MNSHCPYLNYRNTHTHIHTQTHQHTHTHTHICIYLKRDEERVQKYQEYVVVVEIYSCTYSFRFYYDCYFSLLCGALAEIAIIILHWKIRFVGCIILIFVITFIVHVKILECHLPSTSINK